MKKILIVLLLILMISNICQAKEQKTTEQKIINGCKKEIFNYEQNKTIDNEIKATECLYIYTNAYKQDILPLVTNLHYLYANKYENSLDNEQYFNKMYKYAFIALKKGSKDSTLAEMAVYYATKKGNISDLDYAFEVLANVAPEKAKEIKPNIELAKQYITQQNEIKNQQANDYIQKFLNSDFMQNMAHGTQYDELTGRFMSYTEKRDRDNSLLQKGTSYEELLRKKRQNDALKNINDSLHNINSNLNGLRYGY